MTDGIKHECGIALVRLLKPLEYYQLKYGTWRYGLNKLYLLMEKQHNRGQDGAGVASVKFDLPPGHKYIHRHRSIAKNAIEEIFGNITDAFDAVEDKNPALLKDPSWAKNHLPFASEVLLGHLRYGTYGKNKIENVHPVMRQNNWKTRNLVLAGNFNLTNVSEIFDHLVELGQHPKDVTDTVTMLENVGHFLDREVQRLFDIHRQDTNNNTIITDNIANELNVADVLKQSSKKWDGGYAIAGIMGHGDTFVMRDPHGIRPAYYYHDDEIVVVTSERPVIQTVMNVKTEQVKEVPPGKAIIVKKNGDISLNQIREAEEKRSCSFERIYFSRGSDSEIYRERKKLGELLTPQIIESVNNELDDTVFSFIPNTAETAFYGMVYGIEKHMKVIKKEKLKALKDLTDEAIEKIIDVRPRIEKIAIKDIKLRTFISQDSGRDDLVGHVYDVTYDTIIPNVDNLVVIDDSIVRGTTLKQSIIRILDRLEPKSIVVVSSSPQIRYPDCYGIDMAKLGDFIAFRAAIELLNETGQEHIINEVYKKCKAMIELPKEEITNPIKEIYAPFTQQEVSNKIAQMLKVKGIKADVKIVYQTIDNLHKACPNDLGDWYFTGDYPTPGGNKVVISSFINFIEGKNKRAY